MFRLVPGGFIVMCSKWLQHSNIFKTTVPKIIVVEICGDCWVDFGSMQDLCRTFNGHGTRMDLILSVKPQYSRIRFAGVPPSNLSNKIFLEATSLHFALLAFDFVLTSRVQV